jgi:small conductance mechanosensitive channel
MGKAKKGLEEIVNSVDGVISQPPPIVAVSELADSSVNFSVLPCVNVDDAPRVSYLITELVKLRFDWEGVSIPFPQRDIHLYQSNGVSSLN